MARAELRKAGVGQGNLTSAGNFTGKKRIGIIDFDQSLALNLPEPIADIAQKAAIVAHQKAGGAMGDQLFLKRFLALDIKVVCRFIQQVEIWMLQAQHQHRQP